jgi:cytochrome c oxidase subunit 2
VAETGRVTADQRKIGMTPKAVAPLAAVVCVLAATTAAGPPAPGRALAPESGPVEVVASHAGFKPRVLNIRKGEPLRLVVRTADDEHCFALDAFRVEKRLRPGKPVSVELTPDRAGTFPFHCCLESGAAAETEKGELVVAE